MPVPTPPRQPCWQRRGGRSSRPWRWCWFRLLLCQMFRRKVQMFHRSPPCRRASRGTRPRVHGESKGLLCVPPPLRQRPRRLRKPCGVEMARMAAAVCSAFLPRVAPGQDPPGWLCTAPFPRSPCPVGSAAPPGQCTPWRPKAVGMKAIAAPCTPSALQGLAADANANSVWAETTGQPLRVPLQRANASNGWKVWDGSPRCCRHVRCSLRPRAPGVQRR